MSSPAQRSYDRETSEVLWLEVSDPNHVSPASIWVLEDDDDEVTIQREPARHLEHKPVATTKQISESTEGECAREIRILDESQILPGEASFDTIKLNQEIEDATVHGRACTASSNADEAYVKARDPQVRLLDESRVLHGEASFATVMLNGPLGKPAHSPVAEFLLKTNFNRKQLMLASLVLLSALAVAVAVVLKFATSNNVLTSPPKAGPVSNPSPVTAETTTVQKEWVDNSMSDQSVAVSNSQNVISSQATPTTDGVIDSAGKTSSGTINSDEARKETSSKSPQKKAEDAKPAPRAASSERSGRASTASRAVRESQPVIHNKERRPEKSNTKDLRSDVGAKPEPLPPRAMAEKPKEQPLTPPVTGGGERPRRVTP